MSNNKTSTEVWAVLDEVGAVMWTRGGSSTASRMMVYETKAAAERALKNKWTQQAHRGKTATVERIYVSGGRDD